MTEDLDLSFRILARALELPEEERGPFLAEQCGDDLGLLAHLEHLMEQRVDAPRSAPTSRLLQSLQRSTREILTQPDLDLDDVYSLLDLLQRREDALERYELRGEIGRGGAGVVHLAWDRIMHRELALKIIELVDSDAPSEAALRFLREAHVTAQLEHPTIVSAHDLGRLQERELFFTMDLVRGMRLSDLVQGGADLRRTIEVLRHIAEGVAYAHRQGVLHRDITPHNIMVEDFGASYLMDWGLARTVGGVLGPVGARPGTEKAADPSHATGSPGGVTLTSGIQGTLAYVAPEQILGETKKLTPALDVYALGAVLYYVLAGHPPYRGAESAGATVDDLLGRIRSGPPPSLPSTAPHAPRELVAICETAMQRDPQARYASAAAFASDLGAWLSKREISVYRGRLLYRWGKAIQRRPDISAIAASATAVVGLVASLAAFHAIEKRKMAEQERSVATSTLGFLEDVLERTVEVGDKRTVKAMLDGGREQLESSDLPPRVHSLASDILGGAYLDLGEFEAGKRLIEASLPEDGAALEETSTFRAAKLESLAKLRSEEGRPEEAIDILRRCLAIREAEYGPDHFETIRTLGRIVLVYPMDRHQERLELSLEALQRARTSLGPRHPLTREIALDHSIVCLAGGDNEGAARAFDTFEQLLGDASPSEMEVRKLGMAKASLFSNRGQLAEAIEVLETLEEDCTESYGRTSPIVAMVRSHLATSYEKAGRVEEALEMQEELAKYAIAMFDDPLHPNRIAAENNLGIFKSKLGMFEEADAHLAKVHAARLEVDGPIASGTAQALLNWGANDSRAGRVAEAEERLRESLRVYETLDHPGLQAAKLTSKRSLGIHLRNAGRFEEAESILLETLDEHRTVDGETSPNTWGALAALIECYRRMERLDEAIRWARARVEWTEGVEGAHAHAIQQLETLKAN